MALKDLRICGSERRLIVAPEDIEWFSELVAVREMEGARLLQSGLSCAVGGPNGLSVVATDSAQRKECPSLTWPKQVSKLRTDKP